jgi:hypothetical protein
MCMGDHAGTARDGRSHELERHGRTPGAAAGYENVFVGCHIEGQYTPVKTVCEEARAAVSAVSSFRHDGKPEQDFRLRDRRSREWSIFWLRRRFVPRFGSLLTSMCCFVPRGAWDAHGQET